MVNLFYLIGLPASGKSTWAKEHESDNTIWLSSDKIRKELFNDEKSQINNKRVFEEMRKRALEYIKKGKNVIFDATNINSKKRRVFLNQLSINVKKNCIYFATEYLECLYGNENRERKVPIEVIESMYKRLEIPMYFEGWDNISVVRRYNEMYRYFKPLEGLDYSYSEYAELLAENTNFAECIDLPQDNPYHTFSVSRHMYYTYEFLKNETGDKNLIIAGMFHDLGKPLTKNFSRGKYASFIGHENISSQLIFAYLIDCGFEIERVVDIATLVQLHSKIINFNKSNIKMEKFKGLVGENLFKRLELLCRADISAR